MAENASILFVDDERSVLDALRRALRGQRDVWDLHFAQSVDEALDKSRAIDFDAVVTDAAMPGRDGLDLLKTLQGSAETRDIPIVMLTGLDDVDLKRRAMELGAIDLLNKPIVSEDLVARLRSVLRLKSCQDRLKEHNELLERQVRRRTLELERSRLEIIWRLAKAGEFRDEQTGNHVVRVGAFSMALAEELGLSSEFVEMIFLTSPLHDIGKIGVSDTTLLKNGPLTAAEWVVMKQHCKIGYEILQRDPSGLAEFQYWRRDDANPQHGPLENPFLKQAALIALNHHERWDGGGYPNGLQGEQIPLEARIVTIADVYDALSHARPYKPAYPEEQVISIMNEEAIWRFDPRVFAAFQQIQGRFREINHELADVRLAAA